MPRPLPHWVLDDEGVRHEHGTEGYERVMAPHREPTALDIALARIEELTALNEELTARSEAAAAKAEEAAAPLLERPQGDGAKDGGRDA